MLPLPSRGWGPWRQEFYSFHSNPTLIAEDTEHQFGAWRNVWASHAGAVVYRFAPRVWRWFANRPNSSSKRALRRCFPNMK